MLAVQWCASAMEDLATIVEFIAEHDQPAAMRLLGRIDEAVAALPAHPLLYRRGRIAGTREMVVGMQYLVVYRVDAGVIEIVSVVHTRRRYP